MMPTKSQLKTFESMGPEFMEKFWKKMNSPRFEDKVFLNECPLHGEIVITVGPQSPRKISTCGCADNPMLSIFDSFPITKILGRISEPEYEKHKCGKWYRQNGIKRHSKFCGDRILDPGSQFTPRDAACSDIPPKQSKEAVYLKGCVSRQPYAASKAVTVPDSKQQGHHIEVVR